MRSRCARTRTFDDALNAFDEFSVQYQGAVDDPSPLFRRRARAAALPEGVGMSDARMLRRNSREGRTPRRAARFDRRSVTRTSSSPAASPPKTCCSRTPFLSRGVKIGIFSLNTGRLHAETLGMIDRVKERYGYDIEQFHPQPEAVDEYVRIARSERVL